MTSQRIITALVTLILAAPCFAFVQQPAKQINAPERLTIEGLAKVEQDAWNWDGAQRKCWVETPAPYQWRVKPVAFATDSDWREFLRLKDSAVQVRGYYVRRGGESWFVVEVVAERVK